MAAIGEFPCPACGAKKRFHKKGCNLFILKLNPEYVGETMTSVTALTPRVYECCNQRMKRTDGNPDYMLCRHQRLLTDDCPDCRRDRHGVLIYRCEVCGSQVQDAPHLATGPEMMKVAS